MAIGRGRITIPPRRRMKKIGLILLAGFLLLPAPVRLCAQSDDPSEIFLKAYMTSQEGEKLEHDNQFKAALAKYRFAGSLIEELHKTHANWQPAIVEYRGRKITEGILRVQDKVSTQNDLAAGATPLPGNPPPLPQNSSSARASVEIVSPRGEAAVQVSNDTAIREATQKLREKVDQLQAEVQKSRDQT